MSGFQLALVLVLLLTGLTIVGRRLPWPLPLTYVLGAGAISFWPNFPAVHLDPDVFFLCFVPPLLFADGWFMPLRDFKATGRQIFILATGLVAFTTVAVALVAHGLLPALPLAMTFALGAIVSPTDAVAVGAILQRLKVPPRLAAILNGESLLNDATGLVAFNFAIAAVTVGTFSLGAATVEFVWVAAGGIVVGLAVGWLVGRLRDLVRRSGNTDAHIEITASLMTPYAAYLVAQSFEFSAILAVVAAGLYSGWRDPLRMTAEERRTAFAVWGVALYWLNGLAFLLLGLQVPEILRSVGGDYSAGQLAWFAAAVVATAVLTRLLWVFAGTAMLRLFPRTRAIAASWGETAVAGWAGMRGTITLAAALSIPLALPDGTPFPGRGIVVFLAFSVILGTLLLQGTTMEYLICRVGLPPDDSILREDRMARLAAIEAGLRVLRARAQQGGSPEEMAALGVLVGEYEGRLAELTAGGESQQSASRRLAAGREFQLQALQAERAAIDELWTRDFITDETHRPLQALLDHEEAMLQGR